MMMKKNTLDPRANGIGNISPYPTIGVSKILELAEEKDIGFLS